MKMIKVQKRIAHAYIVGRRFSKQKLNTNKAFKKAYTNNSHANFITLLSTSVWMRMKQSFGIEQKGPGCQIKLLKMAFEPLKSMYKFSKVFLDWMIPILYFERKIPFEMETIPIILSIGNIWNRRYYYFCTNFYRFTISHNHDIFQLQWWVPKSPKNMIIHLADFSSTESFQMVCNFE